MKKNKISIKLILFFIFIFIILIISIWSSNKGKEKNKEKKVLTDANFQKISSQNSTDIISTGNKMVLTDNDGNLTSIGFPRGIILLFSGRLSDIPEGWALCDGKTNSTPDLRGRFVIGANHSDNRNTSLQIRNMGDSGGVEKLGLKNIPPHTHRYFDAFMSEDVGFLRSNNGMTITNKNEDWTVSTGQQLNARFSDFSGPGLGLKGLDIYDLGNNPVGRNENTAPQPEYLIGDKNTGVDHNSQEESLPPYYVLAYIMKI